MQLLPGFFSAAMADVKATGQDAEHYFSAQGLSVDSIADQLNRASRA